jgi:hypothetical protein
MYANVLDGAALAAGAPPYTEHTERKQIHLMDLLTKCCVRLSAGNRPASHTQLLHGLIHVGCLENVLRRYWILRSWSIFKRTPSPAHH